LVRAAPAPATTGPFPDRLHVSAECSPALAARRQWNPVSSPTPDRGRGRGRPPGV